MAKFQEVLEQLEEGFFGDIKDKLTGKQTWYAINPTTLKQVEVRADNKNSAKAAARDQVGSDALVSLTKFDVKKMQREKEGKEGDKLHQQNNDKYDASRDKNAKHNFGGERKASGPEDKAKKQLDGMRNREFHHRSNI